MMKRFKSTLCLILAMAILVSFCAGCTNKTDVVISVSGDQIGTPLESIPVSVTVNGKDTPCRVEWSMLNDAMDAYGMPTETLEAGHQYRVHVYYNADAALGDENLQISVEGAELDYSEMAGEEIMTVALVNLLDKGNLSITCIGVALGAPFNPYMSVRLDGESVPVNYLWTVTTGDVTENADDRPIVEYGKAYQVHFEFFPDEGFKLEDWPVRVNCGDGMLTSIEQKDDVVYATVTYIYNMPSMNFEVLGGVDIYVGSDQVGTALASVPVFVQVAGLDVSSRAEWQVLNDTKDAYVPASGTLEEGKDYLVYIYYSANLTEDDLAADKIQVTGAELDHSEFVGDEILTVVRVNLLEKGNLTLTVGSTFVGMPIDASYCAVKLDGETLYSYFNWSILKGGAEEPADENGFFEEGKNYQLSLFFIPPDDFNPDDWNVRLNCEGGELISLEPEGAEYLAKIAFNYGGDHVCKFELNESKPATNSCTKNGEVFYICPECGAEKTETAYATGHTFDWSKATYTAPQNCQQHGSETASCVLCGAVETRATSDVGSHAWKETGSTDNCDAGLTTTYSCSVCKQTKTETTASSHGWSETAREDLCDLGMTVYYVCDKCGASKNEVLASGHDWVRIDQAGSCPYGVQLMLSCKKCGEIDTSQWLAPKDHTFGSASYWNNHTHVSYCTECGEEKRESHSTDSKGYCAACDSWIVN